MSDNKNSLIELYKQREKLTGTRIVRMTLRLKRSQYIVNRNYQELSNAISVFEKHYLFLMSIDNREKFEAFMRELDRFLHNYLSSIFSLIQHTSVFCKRLNNPQLSSDYRKEVDGLQANKVTRFLKDLRVYTQHEDMPVVTAYLSLERPDTKTEFGEVTRKLLLMKVNLLEWDGWTHGSKLYISQYSGDIDLKIVIGEYHDLIVKFYNWFYQRVTTLFAREIEELRRIEAEINRLRRITNAI